MKNLTLIAVMAIFLPFLGGCVVVTVRGTHPHTHNNYRTTRTYCDVCCGYGCGYANHQSYYRLVEVPRYRTSHSHGHHQHTSAPRQTQRRMTTQSYQSSSRPQQASRSRIQRQTADRRSAYRQSTQDRVEQRKKRRNRR